MSAFMCDPELVSLLVHGAERGVGNHYGGGLRWWARPITDSDEDGGQALRDELRRELKISAHPFEVQFVMDMLVTENMRSIMARYPDTVSPSGEPIIDNMPGLIGADWTYSATRSVREATWVDVLKACSCYAYQTCETPDWPQTEAYQFIDALRHKAVANLAGYDDSPWWK